MSEGIEHYREWIGRTARREDVLSPGPAERLAATLDRTEDLSLGAPLPALWHWVYFLEAVRRSETGPDGHARRGGFLPPVDLPRRMFAGGRFEWHRPGLLIGDTVSRTGTVVDVSEKTGRTGRLVFVLCRFEFHVGGELRLAEERDIVYREAPTEPYREEPPTIAERGPWQAPVTPDPVLLFRYSALTFNGHRIHYDEPYVTGEEGYPGLVVHGPLIAQLLADLFRDGAGARRLARFSFRARRPVFHREPFEVTGWPGEADGAAKLHALTPGGHLAMEAEAVAAGDG